MDYLGNIKACYDFISIMHLLPFNVSSKWFELSPCACFHAYASYFSLRFLQHVKFNKMDQNTYFGLYLISRITDLSLVFGLGETYWLLTYEILDLQGSACSLCLHLNEWMNEVVTYIPPFIRSMTRSQSGSQYIPQTNWWAAYLGRTE